MSLINLVEILIGFAGGLAVGAGFVAFLTVLGIIPRLVQLSKSSSYIQVYEAIVILGVMFGTLISFGGVTLQFPYVLVAVWGAFHGVFIGMLAAALTEVLNVFPLLAKRIRLQKQLIWLLMAIVFGKIFGSLFQWIIFVQY